MQVLTPACCPAPRAAQLPWTALISLSLPIPIRRAVLAQALLVALSVAWLPSLRASSFSLCAANGGYYQTAAAALSMAVACVLPPPLGVAALARAQRLGPAAAFYAVHVMGQAAVNCGLVLSVLFSWELRQRRPFARQRRLGGDAAALVRLQRNSALSAPLLALAGTLLWEVVAALLAASPAD